jgi:hypothetical protein
MVPDFSRVRIGIPKDEVRRIMGPPDEMRPFILNGDHLSAWIYRAGAEWAVVLFDADGRVKIRHRDTFGAW